MAQSSGAIAPLERYNLLLPPAGLARRRTCAFPPSIKLSGEILGNDFLRDRFCKGAADAALPALSACERS
jgi:hypothetical protein